MTVLRLLDEWSDVIEQRADLDHRLPEHLGDAFHRHLLRTNRRVPPRG